MLHLMMRDLLLSQNDMADGEAVMPMLLSAKPKLVRG
jgi:hypothetical protein